MAPGGGAGAAAREWQVLGEASLLALQPDLAAAAFQRAQDPRMLHAAAYLASKKAQGLSEGCLHAYSLALLVSYQRSSECTARNCSVRTLRHGDSACRAASMRVSVLKVPLQLTGRASLSGEVVHDMAVACREDSERRLRRTAGLAPPVTLTSCALC